MESEEQQRTLEEFVRIARWVDDILIIETNRGEIRIPMSYDEGLRLARLLIKEKPKNYTEPPAPEYWEEKEVEDNPAEKEKSVTSLEDKINNLENQIIVFNNTLEQLKAQKQKRDKESFDYRNDTVQVLYRDYTDGRHSGKTFWMRKAHLDLRYTRNEALESMLENLSEARADINRAINYVQDHYEN